MYKHTNVAWAIFMVVIIILAVLILQQFTMLSKDLRLAYARSIAANLTAVSAVNYTQKKFNPINGSVVLNCNNLNKSLHVYLPSQYTIQDEPIRPDEMIECTILGKGINNIHFKAIGAS